MNIKIRLLALAAAWFVSTNALAADPYADTMRMFKTAGESGKYFANSYGYAVFPTIGKAGLGVGAAHGKGRMYEHSRFVGNVSMTQLSVGLQAGGQAFSEIIFFENKDRFSEFKNGNFEFGADIGAIAVTVAANAGASSSGGASAGASASKTEASASGGYQKGVAVFTIAKGGLMYQAAVQGQKFSYERRGK